MAQEAIDHNKTTETETDSTQYGSLDSNQQLCGAKSGSLVVPIVFDSAHSAWRKVHQIPVGGSPTLAPVELVHELPTDPNQQTMG